MPARRSSRTRTTPNTHSSTTSVRRSTIAPRPSWRGYDRSSFSAGRFRTRSGRSGLARGLRLEPVLTELAREGRTRDAEQACRRALILVRELHRDLERLALDVAQPAARHRNTDFGVGPG